MGKKEKLLIRTHTCQPSGLFGFRTRFTFLLAGQADVFRIFCLWLLSVFHSASHCSRAKTKDVTHFSLVSVVVFHLVRPKIAHCGAGIRANYSGCGTKIFIGCNGILMKRAGV